MLANKVVTEHGNTAKIDMAERGPTRSTVLEKPAMETTTATDEKRTDRRTIRAATESMTTHLEAPGLIRVYTTSDGGQQGHLVDVVSKSCECEDYRYNQPEGGCKHVRRVELELGEREIPDLPGRSDVEMMIDARQEAI